ncbi:acetylcholinesterase-like [Dreissena polymorpha]|uniref:Carboxylesterase type B domain-containing protein n=1 Tax=Dreissena polymorpha TaxID=45954 RepID=A0A9D4N8Z1_DREPO|nr:acetylcholinesterase-like [Dreissena polymorpha]KAH3890256.1 hypothetical protein DPMN_014330 [Dreissena polymorpha]
MVQINMTCISDLFSLVCILAIAKAARPRVSTKLGTMHGYTRTGEFNGKHYAVNEYLGIPYAKPPVGELRFKRPQPFGNLSSPFNATRYGSACPQSDFLKLGMRSTTENCLFLNIFVPQTPKDTEQGHAVMVFIHGGGFKMGTGEMTPGHVLSWFGNVIVLTFNYRIGMFGFLNLGTADAKGNQGLWDQRLALQWVHDNIEEFGGDSGRVTIFGEAAGAISVTMQSMYPANRGLFQNAIAESGTICLNFGLTEDNKFSAKMMSQKLNCNLETDIDVFKCLLEVSPEHIIAFTDKLINTPSEAMEIPFVPTVDGEFFRQHPKDTFNESKQQLNEEIKFLREIRFINGVNGMEGAMWLSMAAGNSDSDIDRIEISDSAMKTLWIPAMLGQEMPGKEIFESVKQLVAYEYTDWQHPKDATEMLVKLTGDVYFNIPALKFSKLHSNSTHAKSWLYSFEPKLDQHLLKTPRWIQKANHGDDLAPVFGYALDYEHFAGLKDYSPPQWEYGLSERIMGYWTNFAKFGDPNGDGPPFWPQYDPETQQNIFIDRQDSIGHNLYAKEVAFWGEVLPSLMDAIDRRPSFSEESPFSHKSTETCDADRKCG